MENKYLIGDELNLISGFVKWTNSVFDFAELVILLDSERLLDEKIIFIISDKEYIVGITKSFINDSNLIIYNPILCVCDFVKKIKKTLVQSIIKNLKHNNYHIIYKN